jgi:hypothetical protein
MLRFHGCFYLFRKEFMMVFNGVRRDVFGGIGGVSLWWEADKGAGGSPAGAPGTGDGGSGNADAGVKVDFESWQTEWSEPQKKAFDAYEGGLKSALQKERDAKGELEKQLRSLSKKADGQEDLQKQLQTMADALKAATDEARFVTEASTREVGCTNPKLAMLAARADGLIGSNGNVDWDGLKKSYPQLFRDGSKVPDANAGNGNGQQHGAVTMDDLLRKK